MPPRVPPAAPGRGSLLGSLRLSVARFPPLVAGLGGRGHPSSLRPTHRDDLSRSLRPQASAASTAAIPTPPQTTRAGRSVRCNRPPPRRTEPTVLEPAPRADRPPPCEECRGRRSRRAHRLACRDAASSGSRGTSPLRRRQLATRLTGVSRGTSSGQEARSKGAGGRREEDLGGETRWPLEHVGRHEGGSARAIHKDARCATLYEENDRGEQRYTHRTPRPSQAALWAHRSSRHRHPERDAEQHDQHHQQDDDGDLQHVDDRTTRPLRTPSIGRSCGRRRPSAPWPARLGRSDLRGLRRGRCRTCRSRGPRPTLSRAAWAALICVTTSMQ